VDGVLLAVFFKEGDDVPVLTNVCVIGEEGESWDAFLPDLAQPAQPEALDLPKHVMDQAGQEGHTPPAPDADTLMPASGHTSPRARQLAKSRKLDLSNLEGTGPGGRILERDVRELIATGDKPPVLTTIDQPVVPAIDKGEYWDEKLTLIRRVIAQTMLESMKSTAQLTYHSSFDATALLALRKDFKEAKEQGMPGLSAPEMVPTVTDLILYVVSRIILEHPASNAHFLDDHIRYFKHAHLGCAVDTPRGLMVPVIKYADQLSLGDISAQVRELAAAAQTGTINPDTLKDGTFTVSNLGNLGVEHFTPILNPPQTSLLGVGSIVTRVREVDGNLQAYPAMGLSLTHDHRAYDGAPAARLLRDICLALEKINFFLIEKI
jgi:pyruvate dehydrogenase E2 component (dihydrolipoamide acetyltransferase)